MSVKINIPAYMTPLTDNLRVVEVNGSTVGESLNHLSQQFPALNQQLFSQSGDLFEYIIISVNGENTYPQQLAVPVKDGDELDITTIISGR